MFCAILFSGVAIYGRRLVLFGGPATLRSQRNPHFGARFTGREGLTMDILGLVVGILSLCGTCFAIGYQFGKDSRGNDCGESHRNRYDKTQK